MKGETVLVRASSLTGDPQVSIGSPGTAPLGLSDDLAIGRRNAVFDLEILRDGTYDVTLLAKKGFPGGDDYAVSIARGRMTPQVRDPAKPLVGRWSGCGDLVFYDDGKTVEYVTLSSKDVCGEPIFPTKGAAWPSVAPSRGRHVGTCRDCAGVSIPDGPVTLTTTAGVTFDAALADRRPGKKVTASYCESLSAPAESRTEGEGRAHQASLRHCADGRAFLEDGGAYALGTWSMQGAVYPTAEKSTFMIGLSDEVDGAYVTLEGYVRAKQFGGAWELLHEGAVTAFRADTNVSLSPVTDAANVRGPFVMLAQNCPLTLARPAVRATAAAGEGPGRGGRRSR